MKLEHPFVVEILKTNLHAAMILDFWRGLPKSAEYAPSFQYTLQLMR